MRRLIGILTGLMLGLGSLIILGALGSAPASAKDMNCDDFNTQADAQHYFNNNGGGPNNNVDGLDSDGDGVVCESNPCPCSTGGGGNNPPPPPAKKKHALTAKVVRTGPAKELTLNGKVTTFKGGQVQVFRKAAGSGYKLFKKSTASPKTGAFSRPLAYIGFEKTCFQVVVPETKKYLKTVKSLGCFIKP